MLVKFNRQNGIIVVDLTSAVREHARQEVTPLYFSRDSHLNVKGNA